MSTTDNDLFKIVKVDHHDNIISASLNINKDCKIFNGHFPNQPIVPGACMLQIIKDVLEDTLNVSLRLKKADYLKFVAMINPEDTQNVTLDLSYKFGGKDSFSVNGKLVTDEVVCFKFQGSFMTL